MVAAQKLKSIILVYHFGRKRHGQYYEQKKVEVFYTLQGDVIVTVTVYVFYGKWVVDADSV
jgi:hypothetical protein